MPVTVSSRYRGLTTLAVAFGDDASTAIARRPQPAPVATSHTHVLTGVETVEYLAWRYYGRSRAWWHIADANPLSFPLDWHAGQAVAIPASTAVGRVTRTREV